MWRSETRLLKSTGRDIYGRCHGEYRGLESFADCCKRHASCESLTRFEVTQAQGVSNFWHFASLCYTWLRYTWLNSTEYWGGPLASAAAPSHTHAILHLAASPCASLFDDCAHACLSAGYSSRPAVTLGLLKLQGPVFAGHQ